MPRIKETVVSFGIGGQVAIHDYGKLNTNFSLFQSEKYEHDESESMEEALAFRAERREKLIEELEAVAQKEQDWRIEWRAQEQKKLRDGEQGDYS
jgi:hypothetical protein